MSFTLTNDDRCVVDLLLDASTQTTNAGQSVNSCFTTDPSAKLQQRMNKVDQLLANLDQHVAGDPPVDLLARTLARCERTPVSAPPEVREGVVGAAQRV